MRDGDIVIDKCYFEGCFSSYAATLHVNNTNVEIINTTFNKNYSAKSNEMVNLSNASSAVVKFCTMVQDLNYNGNAFEVVESSKCSIYNSIIINNNKTPIFDGPTNNIYIHNCILDKEYLGAQNSMIVDPILVSSGYYGGNVKTMPVAENSPAVNAGMILSDVIDDARGLTRSELTPTIGAYEYLYGKLNYEKWV